MDLSESSPQWQAQGYWARAQRPLPSLILLLPLLLIYELALPIFGVDQIRQVASDIAARRAIYEFLAWFDISGYYLPALIVVVVLIVWHTLLKDPWRFEPSLYAGMLAEAMVLTLPLIVLATMVGRHMVAAMEPAAGAMIDSAGVTDGSALAHAVPLLQATTSTGQAAATPGGGWSVEAQLVFGIGAGIYEELVFRLMGIALIHLLLADVLGLAKKWAAVAAVVISSLAFGLYHFIDVDVFPAMPEFSWPKMIFFTLAGLYLACIYLLRGFGIAAATHAFYDVLVVLLQVTADPASG